MKVIMVFYNMALDSEVMEFLKKLDVNTYTKLPGIFGAGSHSSPRLDTLVWPGKNNGLFILTDENKKTEIMHGLKELKKEYPSDGLKAIVLEAVETT